MIIIASDIFTFVPYSLIFHVLLSYEINVVRLVGTLTSPTTAYTVYHTEEIRDGPPSLNRIITWRLIRRSTRRLIIVMAIQPSPHQVQQADTPLCQVVFTIYSSDKAAVPPEARISGGFGSNVCPICFLASLSSLS